MSPPYIYYHVKVLHDNNSIAFPFIHWLVFPWTPNCHQILIPAHWFKPCRTSQLYLTHQNCCGEFIRYRTRRTRSSFERHFKVEFCTFNSAMIAYCGIDTTKHTHTHTSSTKRFIVTYGNIAYTLYLYWTDPHLHRIIPTFVHFEPLNLENCNWSIESYRQANRLAQLHSVLVHWYRLAMVPEHRRSYSYSDRSIKSGHLVEMMMDSYSGHPVSSWLNWSICMYQDLIGKPMQKWSKRWPTIWSIMFEDTSADDFWHTLWMLVFVWWGEVR